MQVPDIDSIEEKATLKDKKPASETSKKGDEAIPSEAKKATDTFKPKSGSTLLNTGTVVSDGYWVYKTANYVKNISATNAQFNLLNPSATTHWLGTPPPPPPVVTAPPPPPPAATVTSTVDDASSVITHADDAFTTTSVTTMSDEALSAANAAPTVVEAPTTALADDALNTTSVASTSDEVVAAADQAVKPAPTTTSETVDTAKPKATKKKPPPPPPPADEPFPHLKANRRKLAIKLQDGKDPFPHLHGGAKKAAIAKLEREITGAVTPKKVTPPKVTGFQKTVGKAKGNLSVAKNYISNNAVSKFIMNSWFGQKVLSPVFNFLGRYAPVIGLALSLYDVGKDIYNAWNAPNGTKEDSDAKHDAKHDAKMNALLTFGGGLALVAIVLAATLCTGGLGAVAAIGLKGAFATFCAGAATGNGMNFLRKLGVFNFLGNVGGSFWQGIKIAAS